MRIVLRHRQHQIVVTIRRDGDRFRVATDDAEQIVEARFLDDSTLVLVIDGHRYQVALARNGLEHFVAIAGEAYTFVHEAGGPAAHSVVGVASPEITAPMPGKVLQVLAREGDHVTAGEGLLIVEAMKMENRLTADAAATVAEIRVAAGDVVDAGQVLMVLRYDEADA
jgi:biotin carboxyl carrier protein